jgi:hypothetical protein
MGDVNCDVGTARVDVSQVFYKWGYTITTRFGFLFMVFGRRREK